MCHEFITPLSVVVAYMRAYLGYPQSDTFIIILNITFQKVDSVRLDVAFWVLSLIEGTSSVNCPTFGVENTTSRWTEYQDIITFFCAREASVAQQLNGT